MAFLKENPRLARSNVRFALWGCETYQLLGGGDANSHFPSLQALAEEVYGPVSAPHMALHEGARYWGLLCTSPELPHPQRYLAHLNQDLNVLRSARVKLRQWLKQSSSSKDDGKEFRVSTDELNELCVAHAVLYKSIAVLLVSVVRSHATRFLKEKPMVPLATWWGEPAAWHGPSNVLRFGGPFPLRLGGHIAVSATLHRGGGEIDQPNPYAES
ncbi:ankyrin repeat-containing domain protein [Apiospora arundinis]